MVSIMEIMQLCRLCLVKEQVNIPIFEEQDDVRQICLKITSCLPVKITKEDKLPKKICDGCLYKLELLYQFYNTTANAEKQLLTWIEQINMDANEKNLENLAAQSTPPTVKQEKLEPVESTNENPDMSAEAQNYMLDQETFQPDFTFKESQGSTADAVDAAENSDEPLAKRPRRGRPRQATKPIPPESLDSSDNDNDNDDAGDSMLEMTVTKTEEESESEGEENVDDPEPTKFEAVGEDTEQPGPSGLGKGGADGPPERKPSLKSIRITKITSKSKTKIWSCKSCNEVFPTRKSMIEHRKQTHSFPLEAIEYQYTYNNAEDLYNCNTCDTEMKTKEEIEKHMLTHEDKFVCSECQQTFYSAYKFSIHMRKHADQEVYKCPLCDYRTTRRTSISIHINRVHLQKFHYNCKFCGKGFQDVVTFREHENIHMGAQPLYCVVCGKMFTFTRNLTMHQVRNHTVTISGAPMAHLKQCPLCKKCYVKQTTLERHVKTHDRTKPKEKTHLCDTCGKSFARKDKLILHHRVHTGYKPYKCHFCEKSFTKRDYLVLHERTHSGEKPYCCAYCGKCFNQDAPLRIHVRGHTGERPYVCELCNRGFVSRGALNMHMKNCKSDS